MIPIKMLRSDMRKLNAGIVADMRRAASEVINSAKSGGVPDGAIVVICWHPGMGESGATSEGDKGPEIT